MSEKYESNSVVTNQDTKSIGNKVWQNIKGQLAKVKKSTWKTIAAIVIGIVTLLFVWEYIVLAIILALLFIVLKNVPLWVWIVALWDR